MTGATARNRRQSSRFWTIALFGALAIASQPGGATAQQKGESSMKILRGGDQEIVEGPTQYFTGKATIKGLFAREDPSRLTGAIVTFEPGARTAWHSHPLGQTLIVTDGVGWTQIQGEEKVEFEAGDIMLCPKDKPHWHGATPTSSMTHIALQEALDGENVVWMEKVSDEEYLGAARSPAK